MDCPPLQCGERRLDLLSSGIGKPARNKSQTGVQDLLYLSGEHWLTHMTAEELNDLGIRNWSDIRGNYDHPDLLLGNGFSIRQDNHFTYTSLFQIFLDHCPERLRPSFVLFDTANFELILEYLSYTVRVNESLGIEVAPVQQLIDTLKNGLVDSIRRVHPTVGDINWNNLDAITADLDFFNDIFTTNYDLYLYHIIMRAKDRYAAEKEKGTAADPNIRPYNDYFWGRHNAPPGYLEFVDYQVYLQYKHIYHLHGALFVFQHGQYNIKIKSKLGAELISVIAAEIQGGRFPVFVSEGTPEDKVNSIYRSAYLRFCLETLANAQRPILIYGHSLSEVDKHILDAIIREPRPVIYAIYINDRTEHSLMDEKYDIINKFPNDFQIELVDSSTVFSA